MEAIDDEQLQKSREHKKRQRQRRKDEHLAVCDIVRLLLFLFCLLPFFFVIAGRKTMQLCARFFLLYSAPRYSFFSWVLIDCMY
jgi:hypothetical protein